jgi:prepilin-type N-terminal cleavage/methylation domain-containing protein
VKRQRGFTLIELLVALSVSAMLVGLILAIFTRMSLAYRRQQQIAGVQQVLNGAKAMILDDARQAGFGMPTGLKIAGSGVMRFSPVIITNHNNGPDEITFMYADATTQSAVTANGNAAANVPVDDNSGFAVGDIVVIANPDPSTPNPIDPLAANVTTYTGCILRVSNVPNGVSIHFDTAPPFGEPANSHCPALVKGQSVLMKMVAHAYRIDPGRPAEGVLQMSPTGNLYGLNDWQDLAYGFTDIQVATQFYDGDGIDTLDPDADPNRDWYSGDLQTTFTQPVDDATQYKPPLQLSITLVARTDRDVEGIATPATPQLIDPANPNNNTIGDHPSVVLPDAANPALQGNRVYRYTTFQVDLRNTGVGR